jgi:signal recognition particle receptor subunit beta
MGFGTVIVLVIAMVCITTLLQSRYRAKHGITVDWLGNQHLANKQDLPDADLQREVTELRERIKVLERIATEDQEARRLSTQIEQLRDK